MSDEPSKNPIKPKPTFALVKLTTEEIGLILSALHAHAFTLQQGYQGRRQREASRAMFELEYRLARVATMAGVYP